MRIQTRQPCAVVTHLGRTTPPRSSLRVDTSYVRRPPLSTTLRAVTVPTDGGETEFSNQYRAYETLSAHSTREDKRMLHRWSPGDVVMWDNIAVMHRADHSAVSGDRTLHRGLVLGPTAAIA